MVERGGLENRCTLAGTVGSNPTPSANLSSTESIDPFRNERSTRPICKHFANITFLEVGLNVRFPPKSGRVTCRVRVTSRRKAAPISMSAFGGKADLILCP